MATYSLLLCHPHLHAYAAEPQDLQCTSSSFVGLFKQPPQQSPQPLQQLFDLRATTEEFKQEVYMYKFWRPGMEPRNHAHTRASSRSHRTRSRVGRATSPLHRRAGEPPPRPTASQDAPRRKDSIPYLPAPSPPPRRAAAAAPLPQPQAAAAGPPLVASSFTNPTAGFQSLGRSRCARRLPLRAIPPPVPPRSHMLVVSTAAFGRAATASGFLRRCRRLQ